MNINLTFIMKIISSKSFLIYFLSIFAFYSCSSPETNSPDPVVNPDPVGTPGIIGNVSTLAGRYAGENNGTGVSASFDTPQGLFVDNNGNVYVADTYNEKIRKITPAGVVTTIAGNTAIGQPSDYVFDSPYGIIVDDAGNIFVTNSAIDNSNAQINKISPTGTVTTFIENTVIQYPFGLCRDNVGNMYLADGGAGKIRKITPAGVLTTVAGYNTGYLDGPGNSAKFNSPKGLCISPTGVIYVADSNNHKIRKISTSGDVTTKTGGSAGFADGNLSDALFNYPQGICRDDSGNLYVADTYNHRIRKISTAVVVSTLAGSTMGFSDGSGATAKFNYPTSIVYSNNKLYVADSGGNRIRVIE